MGGETFNRRQPTLILMEELIHSLHKIIERIKAEDCVGVWSEEIASISRAIYHIRGMVNDG